MCRYLWVVERKTRSGNWIVDNVDFSKKEAKRRLGAAKRLWFQSEYRITKYVPEV